MNDKLSRRSLVAGMAAVSLFAIHRRAARAAGEPLRLRCSLDTAPSHGRNLSIIDYLKKLEEASGGSIKGEVFPSGELFPDLDVGKR